MNVHGQFSHDHHRRSNISWEVVVKEPYKQENVFITFQIQNPSKTLNRDVPELVTLESDLS